MIRARTPPHLLTHALGACLALFLPLGSANADKPSATGLAHALESEARRSMIQGKIGLAGVLLEGAWELGGEKKTLFALCQVTAMRGLNDEALVCYRRVLKLSPSPTEANKARSEIARLERAPAPFADELKIRPRATPWARRAFKLGVSYARRRRHLAAIRILRTALVLDPELPGTYRVLGGVHGRLKDGKKERAFLLHYLRMRPVGRIAGQVRQRLAKRGVLGTLAVDASYPCEVWIGGRPTRLVTPVKAIALSPGGYTVSLVSRKHHLVKNYRVDVRRGETSAVRFAFGAILFALKPWARVRADGRDLGLWGLVGLPAGRYRLSLKAYDGSKQRDVVAHVKPGETLSYTSWESLPGG